MEKSFCIVTFVIIVGTADIVVVNKSIQTKTKKKTEQDEDKKKDKDKIKSYQASYFASSSSIGRTVDKKLDISKAEIEYDEKSGILSIIIPKIVEENLGKSIEVKIIK